MKCIGKSCETYLEKITPGTEQGLFVVRNTKSCDVPNVTIWVNLRGKTENAIKDIALSITNNFDNIFFTIKESK